MSLVGTRPPTLDEWEKYEPHHRARMSFRPGLTGLWQVSGRSNITDFEEVVKLDTKYIGEWSVNPVFYLIHHKSNPQVTPSQRLPLTKFDYPLLCYNCYY